MLVHVEACSRMYRRYLLLTCTRAPSSFSFPLPAKLSCLSWRRPPWHGIGKVPQWDATSPSNLLSSYPRTTPLPLRLQYLEYSFSFCFCSIAIVGRINSLQTALKYHSRLSVCACVFVCVCWQGKYALLLLPNWMQLWQLQYASRQCHRFAFRCAFPAANWARL